MKTLRASLLAPLFGLLLSVAACSGQAPLEGSAQTDEAVTQAAASSPRVHGRTSLLAVALRDPSLHLTDDQRATLEAAAKTLAPKRSDGASRKAALAAAVRNGDVDAFTATPKPENGTEKKAARSNALTVLHATLTKEQRVALVAAVEKEQGEKKHAGKKHGAKHAHQHAKGTFASLDLTAEQKAQIEAKLRAETPAKKTAADREAMKAKRVAAKKARGEKLRSFTEDSFDVAAFLARPEGAPEIARRGGIERRLAIIVPVLTAEQREKLALRIEQGHPKPAAL